MVNPRWTAGIDDVLQQFVEVRCIKVNLPEEPALEDGNEDNKSEAVISNDG
jgi:hypothetical protein